MVYNDPPWVFKGRALYQLQLVKSEEARKYIPSCFKLVEAFGYTLGGFYLARYEDSPVGAFDELVSLAGLVWNPPTSCAWAARVYVNNREARDHGLHSVGLPSRLAAFKELPAEAVSEDLASAAAASKSQLSWWHRPAAAQSAAAAMGSNVVQVSNVDHTRGRQLSLPVCTLSLPASLPQGAFAGPRIRLALPSFSGGSPDHPELLEYSCDLLTNVRFVPPAKVSVPRPVTDVGKSGGESDELMSAVLGGKPLICMEFGNMEMTVQEPLRLAMPEKQDTTPVRGAALVPASTTALTNLPKQS